jgi:3D (Asp-Asp-Asp) domain-containing protein
MFNVHPSVAENLAPLESEQQTQQRENPAGKSLSGEPVAEISASEVAETSTKLENSTTLDTAKLDAHSAPLAVGKNNSNASAALLVESYTATAYSLAGRTASGTGVRRGLIAADRRMLPLGSRVRLDAGSYSGEYLVADRGSAVRGHIIDIWVPSTREAMRFGRRPVRLTILSYGARPAARATAKAMR